MKSSQMSNPTGDTRFEDAVTAVLERHYGEPVSRTDTANDQALAAITAAHTAALRAELARKDGFNIELPEGVTGFQIAAWTGRGKDQALWHSPIYGTEALPARISALTNPQEGR